MQLKVLLSPEEKEWLETIAMRRGLSVSDSIRQWIRDEHADASRISDDEIRALTSAFSKLGVKPGGRP